MITVTTVSAASPTTPVFCFTQYFFFGAVVFTLNAWSCDVGLCTVKSVAICFFSSTVVRERHRFEKKKKKKKKRKSVSFCCLDEEETFPLTKERHLCLFLCLFQSRRPLSSGSMRTKATKNLFDDDILVARLRRRERERERSKHARRTRFVDHENTTFRNIKFTLERAMTLKKRTKERGIWLRRRLYPRKKRERRPPPPSRIPSDRKHHHHHHSFERGRLRRLPFVDLLQPHDFERKRKRNTIDQRRPRRQTQRTLKRKVLGRRDDHAFRRLFRRRRRHDERSTNRGGDKGTTTTFLSLNKLETKSARNQKWGKETHREDQRSLDV